MPLSFNSLKVLKAFVLSTGSQMHAYKLAKITRMQHQNLYGTLKSLHTEGWLTSHKATTGKGPPRYYTLSELGLDEARRALCEVQVPTLMLIST